MPSSRIASLVPTTDRWISSLRCPPAIFHRSAPSRSPSPLRSPRAMFYRFASSRSPSSNVWIQRQRNDPFVKKRQSTLDAVSYVSRSAFKLIELVDQSPKNAKLLRPGMTVVDLGAAPGGWIQAAHEVLQGEGIVVGVDLLPLQRGIDDLEGVRFIKGDFLDPRVQRKVRDTLCNATGKK